MHSPPPRDQLIADLVATYIDHCKLIYRSREWMNCRSALGRFVLWAPDLTKRSIRLALDSLELERELSIGYRRQVWQRWQRFIRWAVEHEHATGLLIFEISAFRPRFHTEAIDELEPPANPFLIDFYHETRQFLPKLARDVATILASTGARPAEILHLRNCDIDIQGTAAICAVHKCSHRLLARAVPLPPPAWSAIEDRLTPFCPVDWLFPAPNDHARACSTNTVTQQLRATIKKHGLQPWCLYDLRRHAAQVARREAGLDAAQALLGHANSRTTEIYAPCRTDLARDAADHLAREVFG